METVMPQSRRILQGKLPGCKITLPAACNDGRTLDDKPMTSSENLSRQTLPWIASNGP
jgi:hypothetical protein